MKDVIIDPSLLAVLALLACLCCIYMVFFFGRKLQTSAYLRSSLIEGAKQQELKSLLQDLRQRCLEGPLDRGKPPPRGYGSTRRLWEKERFGQSSSSFSSYGSRPPPDESEAQRAERVQRDEERKTQAEDFARWELEEGARYDDERAKLEQEALRRAEEKVPKSIDISLLGGGWSFLLELSAVIIIIFTLLILGILGTLQGREISTILAAIAGYVLGKSTGGVKQTEQSPRGESTGNK